MKSIAILGSTGSIGESTLQIARHLKSEIHVVAIAAKSNIDKLEQQALEFSPKLIAVYNKDKALELKKRIPQFEIIGGMEGLEAVASFQNANMVVSAISGTLGLIPTITAIKAKKDIGLANKEVLVSGGALIISLAKENGVKLLPIDSEHCAIFQCLNSENPATVQRLIITASGGPFRNFSSEQLSQITVENALNHPTWKMGPKITIDSSTLMNKGLEVIEAHWLFNMPLNQIDVVVHPQSIIHSMVEYIDGSIIAQMGEPSMTVPIQYCLTYPKRMKGTQKKFDFTKNHTLQFLTPDTQKFKCLALAYESARKGGTLSCYMNAANEVLVNRFLNKQISWTDIGNKLEHLMSRHSIAKATSIEDILEVDTQARKEATTA